jgi:glycosyltransferase involved in cell wall biosynthesis
MSERQQRLLYLSSPDRGLDVILEHFWPAIHEQVPEALFSFAYAPVYQQIAEQDPMVGAHAARIRELSDQPGVTPLGSLSQPQVARILRKSLVLALPSYNTTHGQPFCETSCIIAAEAQAAGCLVVASGWGALPETVQVGRLVDGPALSDRWRDAFIAEIVDGLTNPDTQAWAQAEGPEHARTLGWQGVGVQVAGLIR